MQFDPVLRVGVLLMEVDLRQLDLTPQILLGEEGPVIRTVPVRAEDHDLTVEAVLPEAKRGGVASPSSTHYHYTFSSHEDHSESGQGLGPDRRDLPRG